jgi:hypothetical protein
MTTKKIDYSGQKKDVFYPIIYPLFAREFIFGNSYEAFCSRCRTDVHIKFSAMGMDFRTLGRKRKIN